MKNIKLMIACPSYGQQMLTPFVSSLFNLSSVLSQQGIAHEVRILSDSLISRLRNTFASLLLHSDCSHILYLDTDLEFPPEAIFQALSLDKDIVGVGCPKKSLDWNKVAIAAHVGTPAQFLPEVAGNVALAGVEASALAKIDGPIPVPAVGTGIMLVKRSVFERLRAAHPELEYTLPDLKECPKYWDVFAPSIHPERRILLGEDYAFCQRAAALGIQSYITINHRIVHWGLFGYVFNGPASKQVDTRIHAITCNTEVLA